MTDVSFQLAHIQNPGDISLVDVLAHIRTQRSGLIQTPEQLRQTHSIAGNALITTRFSSLCRFSYRAVIAGLEILGELEQNERPYVDVEGPSSESDSDADELITNAKVHPKGCRRQDNIMPNSRLSETLEDINCELMRRADSNASSYQPSPKAMHRLISTSESRVSSEDSKHYSQSTPLITP